MYSSLTDFIIYLLRMSEEECSCCKKQLKYVLTTQGEKSRGIIKKVARMCLQSPGEWEQLYKIFGEVYDEIYHEIISKKISIPKRILKVLEILASPMYEQSFLKKQEVYRKVFLCKE